MAVSEGSAVLIIESLEHALARGAHIYAEIPGYGLGCDAFKMTPRSRSSGGIIALKDLFSTPEFRLKMSIMSVHGTGTGENDKSETLIVKTVLETKPRVPRFRLLNLCLGIQWVQHRLLKLQHALMIEKVPFPLSITRNPILNAILIILNEAREMKLDTVISNAYAFAGNTSSLVLRKFKG